MIEVGSRDGEGLKDLLGVSGDVPVFDRPLLSSLQWASRHYLAPLSVLLDKSSPPTLPSAPPALGGHQEDALDAGRSPVSDFVTAVARGKRRPVLAYVTHWRDADWVAMLAPVATGSQAALIVVPTVRESESIAALLTERLGDRVVLVPEGSGSDVTRGWELARGGGKIVIGTPRVAYWKVGDLALGVVFEEGRRAMKDRQTPTVHVRDLMRTRSRIEGFGLLFVGPTPSVELIAAGAETIQVGRPWGLVEVVDRREDPPGSGFIASRSVNALQAAVRKGQRAFVFTHRRAADASFRCASCRSIRICAVCGSHVGANKTCVRCGTEAGACRNCGSEGFESMGSIPSRLVRELGPKLGKENVGDIDEDRPVIVGTERDLAGLAGMGLAVAVDPDALIHGQNYRSSEEALRILARLIGSVGRGQGNRTIVQTSDPSSPLIAALRRGEPIPYLEGVLAARARDGFPPASEMIAIEARTDDPGRVSTLLDDAAPGMVLGPVERSGRHRWLIQGDLNVAKAEMRSALQRMRDGGATLRVDVDPIDL